MALRRIESTPAHEAYLSELKACLGSSGKDIPVDELLAVTAQFVGMLIAHQDRRTMTPGDAMEIVIRGIETGNMTAINSPFGAAQGSA